MKRLLLAGALATAGNGAWFRDLNSPASLAPSAVNDLRAEALSDTSAVLLWTEANSGTTGIAKYVIRYTDRSLVWGALSDLTTGGCGAPVYGSTAGGGRTRSCVISGLTHGKVYSFQLVPYTGTLNNNAVFGPFSNIAKVSIPIWERVGPMLVIRPSVLQDTLKVSAVSVDGWGSWPFFAKLTYGTYTGVLTDSMGVVNAKGYLFIVKP